MIKRIGLITLLIIILLMNSVFALQLADIEHHWAEKFIIDLAEKNIIGGYPDGTFKPNNEITVAEFTTLVTKTLELPAKDSKGEWYQGIIDSAIEREIIKVGEFDDYERLITRGEMARIIVRALGENPSTGNTHFSNDTKIPANLKGYIKRASELKIINGYPNGTFNSSGNATRGEAATVIVKMAEVASGQPVQEPPKQNDFIEPKLSVFENIGFKKGNFYFNITIDNIDDYTDEYLFKAECITLEELNKMVSWDLYKGTYEVDLTDWKDKKTVKGWANQIARVSASSGYNVKLGQEITYKITIKKGNEEKSYYRTGKIVSIE